jgi:AcrR family transcriptional regulator
MNKPLKAPLTESPHPPFMSSERYPDGGRYAEILAQAAKLFAASGFSGASMQDLATAVGISKASLYHFFKDKEEIHSKVVIISLERLNWLVDEKVSRHSTAADRIDAFCRAHAEHLSSNPDLYIAAAMGYQALTNPEIKEQAKAARLAYQAKLQSIVQSGIDSGEFRELDVALAARALISCLNWMARWWKPDGSESAEEIASSYATLIIRGFLPEVGSRPK